VDLADLLAKNKKAMHADRKVFGSKVKADTRGGMDSINRVSSPYVPGSVG